MKTSNNKLQILTQRTTIAALTACAFPGMALATPTGGQVVGGSASISDPSLQGTVINQSSARAIINWQGFSIGSSEYVQFNQPSSSSIALNRVVGADPSTILGNLTANGQVFLVNPNGVYFGPGATLDVGGLVASTFDIRDDDFMSGNFLFTQATAADGSAVVNAGIIQARENGYVVLASARVENSGVIEAKYGQIVLAAGGGINLDIVGDGLVSFNIDAATTKLLAGVDNTGDLIADGGRVVLTGKVSNALVSTAVNNSGLIQAHGIAEQNGEIFLLGEGGDITQSGVLDASGDASGTEGGAGGEIRLITDKGLYLDQSSEIYATGDAGASGGFVEVSGYEDLRVRGRIEIGAGGTLFIDPDTITIADGSGASASSMSDQTIFEQTIEDQLRQGTDVILVADSSITVADLTDDALDGRGSQALNDDSGGMLMEAGAGLGGSLSLDVTGASGDITFNDSNDTLSVDSSVTLSAGSTSGDVTTGDIDAGGTVALTGATIDTGVINTTGNIVITGNATGNDVDYTAGTGISVTGNIDTGGDINLTATTGNITIADATADSGSIDINAMAGSVSAGTLTVDRTNGNDGDADITVNAGTSVMLNGDVGAIAAGNGNDATISITAGTTLTQDSASTITADATDKKDRTATITLSGASVDLQGTVIAKAKGDTNNGSASALVDIDASGAAGTLTTNIVTADITGDGDAQVQIDGANTITLNGATTAQVSQDEDAIGASVAINASGTGNINVNASVTADLADDGDAVVTIAGGGTTTIGGIILAQTGDGNGDSGDATVILSGATTNVNQTVTADVIDDGNASVDIQSTGTTTIDAAVLAETGNGTGDTGDATITLDGGTSVVINSTLTATVTDDGNASIGIGSGADRAGAVSFGVGGSVSATVANSGNETFSVFATGAINAVGKSFTADEGVTLDGASVSAASLTASNGVVTVNASTGNVNLTGTASADTVSVTATLGSVDTTALTANNSVTVSANTTLTIAGAVSGSSASLSAGGALSTGVNTVTASNGITLSAASVTAGDLSASNGSVSVTGSTGAVAIGTVDADSDVAVSAGTTLSVGDVTVTSDSVSLTAGTTLAFNGISSASTIDLSAGGNVTATGNSSSNRLSANTINLAGTGANYNLFTSASAVNATAGINTLTVDNNDANTAFSFTSAGTIGTVDLSFSGSATVGGSAITASSVTIDNASGDLAVNADITVDAGMAVATLTYTAMDGNLTIGGVTTASGSAATINLAAAGSSNDLTINAAVTANASLGVTEVINASATQDVTGAGLLTANNVNITADSNDTVNVTTASANVSVNGADSLTVDNSAFTGSATLTYGANSYSLFDVSFGGVGNLSGAALVNTTDITLTATTLNASALSADNNLTVNGTLSGTAVVLSAGSVLDVDNVNATTGASLSGDTITAGNITTTTGNVTLTAANSGSSSTAITAGNISALGGDITARASDGMMLVDGDIMLGNLDANLISGDVIVETGNNSQVTVADVNANTLTLTGSSATYGDVTGVVNTPNLNIANLTITGVNNYANSFALALTGDLTITGSVNVTGTSALVDLRADGDIAVDNNVTAMASNGNATINIIADADMNGSGDLTQSSMSAITANANNAVPFSIGGGATVTLEGASITQSGSVAANVTNSSLGSFNPATVNVTARSGNASVNNISVAHTGFAPSIFGAENININASGAVSVDGAVATFNNNGLITITGGSAINGSGSLTTQTANLIGGTSANIGSSSAARLQVAAQTVNVSGSVNDVFLDAQNNNVGVNINTDPMGTLDVNFTGTGTVALGGSTPINAQSVSLNSTGALNINQALTAASSLSINAGGLVRNFANTLTANQLNLAGAGSFGSAASRLVTAAPTIVANNSITNLYLSNTAGSTDFSTTGAGSLGVADFIFNGDANISSNVNATTIAVNASGTVTGGSLSATQVTLSGQGAANYNVTTATTNLVLGGGINTLAVNNASGATINFTGTSFGDVDLDTAGNTTLTGNTISTNNIDVNSGGGSLTINNGINASAADVTVAFTAGGALVQNGAVSAAAGGAGTNTSTIQFNAASIDINNNLTASGAGNSGESVIDLDATGNIRINPAGTNTMAVVATSATAGNARIDIDTPGQVVNNGSTQDILGSGTVRASSAGGSGTINIGTNTAVAGVSSPTNTYLLFGFFPLPANGLFTADTVNVTANAGATVNLVSNTPNVNVVGGSDLMINNLRRTGAATFTYDQTNYSTFDLDFGGALTVMGGTNTSALVDIAATGALSLNQNYTGNQVNLRANGAVTNTGMFSGNILNLSGFGSANYGSAGTKLQTNVNTVDLGAGISSAYISNVANLGGATLNISGTSYGLIDFDFGGTTQPLGPASTSFVTGNNFFANALAISGNGNIEVTAGFDVGAGTVPGVTGDTLLTSAVASVAGIINDGGSADPNASFIATDNLQLNLNNFKQSNRYLFLRAASLDFAGTTTAAPNLLVQFTPFTPTKPDGLGMGGTVPTTISLNQSTLGSADFNLTFDDHLAPFQGTTIGLGEQGFNGAISIGSINAGSKNLIFLSGGTISGLNNIVGTGLLGTADEVGGFLVVRPVITTITVDQLGLFGFRFGARASSIDINTGFDAGGLAGFESGDITLEEGGVNDESDKECT